MSARTGNARAGFSALEALIAAAILGLALAPLLDLQRQSVRAAARYDAQPGTVYLLRPDQHVAARWRAFDAQAIEAAIARAVSARPRSGTAPMTRPVAGSVTSIVLPLSASIHSPPTRHCSRNRSGSESSTGLRAAIIGSFQGREPF